MKISLGERLHMAWLAFQSPNVMTVAPYLANLQLDAMETAQPVSGVTTVTFSDGKPPCRLHIAITPEWGEASKMERSDSAGKAGATTKGE